MQTSSPLYDGPAFSAMSFFAATNLLGAPANGSLRGVVTDPSGARVVKATVTVQATDGTTSAVQSGGDGSYSFPQLAPGTYIITVPRRASLWRRRKA